MQLADSDDLFGADEAEDKEIMESLKEAEQQLGKKMKTPTAFKEHPWSPLKYDIEDKVLVQLEDDVHYSNHNQQLLHEYVQLQDDDDIFGQEEAEDKEIMESIKYAEK